MRTGMRPRTNSAAAAGVFYSMCMRNRRRQFALICVSLATVAPAGIAQVTQSAEAAEKVASGKADEAEAELKRLLQESEEFRDQTLASLPDAPDLPDGKSVITAVQLPDRLIIDVDPSVRPGGYRIDLPGGPAALRLRVRGNDLTLVDVLQPEVATRETLSPSGSGLMSGFVACSSMPREGRTQVTRNTDFVSGTLAVNLTQEAFTGEATVVRLIINFSPSRDEDGRLLAEPVNVDLVGQSIADVRRRDPEAFDQYVVPMFKKLGLGGVVDSQTRAMAEQLFLELLPVDETTREKAMTLIETLNDPNFMTRRQAQGALLEMGRPAATVAAGLDPESLSSEQQAQLSLLLERFRTLSQEETERLRNDRDFLESVTQLSGDVEADHLAAAGRVALESLDTDR